MIQVTAQTRVLVMVESIDFRAGIDRLCRICQAQLMSDSFSGTFVHVSQPAGDPH
jgi:hypothetical protein